MQRSNTIIIKKQKATHQTDVGVKAHLDVFPVKLNSSGPYPQRKTPREPCKRAQTGGVFEMCTTMDQEWIL